MGERGGAELWCVCELYWIKNERAPLGSPGDHRGLFPERAEIRGAINDKRDPCRRAAELLETRSECLRERERRLSWEEEIKVSVKMISAVLKESLREC